MEVEMRELTLEEQELIAGGSTSDEIVVTADSGDDWGDWGDWGDYGDYGDWYGDGGGGGGGDDAQPDPTPEEPPCDKADPVGGVTPPDNAKYYVPEGMTADHLNNVINHFTQMAQGLDSPFGLVGAHERVLSEFYNVYTDPSNPYFVDFKDWGTAGGPAGSEGGGQITYWSDAAGQQITTSPYEPFGNFFYGFLGTLAGISPDELYFAAAALQEGSGSGFSDAPEDQPHVNLGIQQALGYAANPHGVLTITNGSCATGVTGSGSVG
jgi:hypothetical protein